IEHPSGNRKATQNDHQNQGSSKKSQLPVRNRHRQLKVLDRINGLFDPEDGVIGAEFLHHHQPRFFNQSSNNQLNNLPPRSDMFSGANTNTLANIANSIKPINNEKARFTTQ